MEGRWQTDGVSGSVNENDNPRFDYVSASLARIVAYGGRTKKGVVVTVLVAATVIGVARTTTV